MSSDARSLMRRPNSIRRAVARVLVVFGFIAFISISGIAGMLAYKQVPVEIWGLTIGYMMEESQTNDIPFLVTEVQQLKEQRELLDKRLVKIFGEHEFCENELNECKRQTK